MQRVGNIVILEDQGIMAARLTDPVAMQRALSCKAWHTEHAAYQGKDSVLISMPWTDEGCQVFTNLGIDATAASPFMFEDHALVEGKYAPMAHQIMTAAFIATHPRCYILSDCRTGKTGAIILAMDYLQRKRYVTGAFLIITTVTTMSAVWKDSLEKTLGNVTVVIAQGKTRESALSEPADFIVTNYDSIRISGSLFNQAVREGRIGACIIDELTHVGNSTSQRHKAINSLVNSTNMRYVIGVTGSPGVNPEATYGMCRVVNPAVMPVRTKTAWLSMTTYQWGTEPFQRYLTDKGKEIMFQTMQPAIRYNKSDIIDLPPITVQDRECAPSREQERILKEFRRDAIALKESGEPITASNGGVLFSKMLQVSLGFVNDNNGKPYFLGNDERNKVIMECIDETSNKVVIFGCFTFANHRLVDDLRSAGYTVELIDGSVPGGKRAEILRAFQYDETPRVLVIHPTTAAFGVELSAADTMIFNGPPPLGGFTYSQALERLSSAKQKASSISIIRISSSREEQKFFCTLDKGQEDNMNIARLFEEIL